MIRINENIEDSFFDMYNEIYRKSKIAEFRNKYSDIILKIDDDLNRDQHPTYDLMELFTNLSHEKQEEVVNFMKNYVRFK